MSAEAAVVVVGTGKVAAPVAATFSALGDHVVVAERDMERASRAARAAEPLAGSAGASVVVECIVENLEVKRQLLGELEGWLDEDALLLSSTSSLSLHDLAAPLRHPERFAGLHFLAISAAAEPPQLLVDAERYGGLYMSGRPTTRHASSACGRTRWSSARPSRSAGRGRARALPRSYGKAESEPSVSPRGSYSRPTRPA